MSSSLLFRGLALLSGVLLAGMIFFNGELARYTTALHSSLVAHGIGAIVAWTLWQLVTQPKTKVLPVDKNLPKVFYLAGLPGAFTVILASMTVNSEIGFAGTISLMILGQVGFGIFVDLLGLFGMKKRSFDLGDFGQLVFTMAGTGVLLFFTR